MGDLQKKAEAIRDERGVGRNTSGRVGEVLVEVSKEVETLKQWKGFNLCGSYDAEREYKKYDLMEYEGASYVALKNFKGITPSGDNIVTQCISRRGDKGESFTYSDFTPEQLVALRGEKGDAFTFGDFTAEQLAALKGKDGKDFTYDDFTPEQLAALKGADGKDGVNGADGIKGDKGDTGKGLTILGYYGTLDLLKTAVTTPEPGDAYGIGTEAPYNIYVFDRVTSDWVDNGKLSGGGEDGGNVVLIPFAITGLTAESTSEEILTAWGGKENLINICKKLNDSKAICKLYGEDENQSMAYIITVNSTNYTDDNNASIELYVGAGSSSLMLQASLANGVASFNIKSQNPVTSTKLPDAIFALTSQSTSEQVLNIFGGIDKIADIYNKIGYSSENQYDILIADNRYNGNGYSVLHNFGGSGLSASHNNGFDRQIYFAYTSIEPTIEVTRWVIKFNNTTATCEVTKKEVGSANIVSIPPNVMTLSNESTSEQIKTAFGGKTAFDAIVEKARAGNAITIVSTNSGGSGGDAGSMTCFLAVNSFVDYSNLEMQIMFTVGIDTLVLNITVANSVFSVQRVGVSALQSSDLVSDPSVGGTDKPASAESVKAVNDRIANPNPKAIACYNNSNIEHTYKVDRNNVLIWRADVNFDAPIVNFIVKEGVTYFEAFMNSACYDSVNNVYNPIEIRVNGKKIGMIGMDGINGVNTYRFFLCSNDPDSLSNPGWAIAIS